MKRNVGVGSVVLASAALALAFGACSSSSPQAPEVLQGQPAGEQARLPDGGGASGSPNAGGTGGQGSGVAPGEAPAGANECGLEGGAGGPGGGAAGHAPSPRFGVCGFKAVESSPATSVAGHFKGAVVSSGVGPFDDRCLGFRLEDADPTHTSFHFGTNDPVAFGARTESFYSFAINDADGVEWRFSFDLPNGAALPLAVGQVVSVDFDSEEIGFPAIGSFTVRDETAGLIAWVGQDRSMPSGREPAELSVQRRAVACSSAGPCGTTTFYGLDATVSAGGATESGLVPPSGTITLAGYSIGQSGNSTVRSNGPYGCANIPPPVSALAFKLSPPATP